MDNSKKTYFIQEHSGEAVYHGGIGNTDIETILLREGCKPIAFPYRFSFSLKAKFARIFYLVKMFFFIPGGSIIVFQYPLYARMNKILLTALSYRHSIKKVCLIADINGLKNGDESVLRDDQIFFQQYKYFILHNESMKLWVDKLVPNNASSLIYFFDFLAKAFEGTRNLSYQVAFAGNLEKSPFLEKLDKLLPDNTRFSLLVYGPGFNSKMNEQNAIDYKSVVEPHQLPQMIEGSFGLVWDGNGSFDNSDSLAHYMKFISHHKLSLYIVSGLPIIVHEDAGSAALIEQYEIGFTIKKLEEIESKISSLSENDYQRMRENLKPIAEKIVNGNNLVEALESLTKQLR